MYDELKKHNERIEVLESAKDAHQMEIDLLKKKMKKSKIRKYWN
jgi:hypothetical protein